MTKRICPYCYCKCSQGFKHFDHIKSKVHSLQSSVPDVELSDLGRGGLLRYGHSGVAPFLYCERLHGTFAQRFDVIEESGWCQNVRRTWNESINLKQKHKLILTFSSRWIKSATNKNKVKSKYNTLHMSREGGDLIHNLCDLTYNDLTRFDRLGDLIGTAHLREADSSQNEDDESRARPAFVLRADFALLSSAVEDGKFMR